MLEPAAGDADELTKEQVAARAWRHRLGLPHDATDAHCCFVEEEAYERARRAGLATGGVALMEDALRANARPKRSSSALVAESLAQLTEQPRAAGFFTEEGLPRSGGGGSNGGGGREEGEESEGEGEGALPSWAEEVVSRVLLRMRQRLLSSAFGRWEELRTQMLRARQVLSCLQNVRLSCCWSSWLAAVDLLKEERAEEEERKRDEEWAAHATVLVLGGQSAGMRDIGSVLALRWPSAVPASAQIDLGTSTSWEELSTALPFVRRNRFSVSSLHGGRGFAVAGGETNEVDSDQIELFDSTGLAGKLSGASCSVERLLWQPGGGGGGGDPSLGWSKAKQMPRSRRGALMVELPDGCLALIGGAHASARARSAFTGRTVLNQVQCYDPAGGRWLTLPAMAHARENFGGCCVSDRLRPGAGSGSGAGTKAGNGWWRVVVAGGMGAVGGANQLSSVEAWDDSGARWEQLPAMPHPAEGCGCAALPGRCVAVVGGRGLASAAVYSFRSGVWSSFPPMSVARCGGGVGYVHGHIVAVGGTGERSEVHASAEAFPFPPAAAEIGGEASDGRSPSAAKPKPKSVPEPEPRWRALAPLPEARRWCHVVPMRFAAADLSAVLSQSRQGRKERRRAS